MEYIIEHYSGSIVIAAISAAFIALIAQILTYVNIL
jgi:hypothetical protein